MKSFRIRSYSGPHFPARGLNTEKYSVPLHIQSECKKMQTRITANTETFYEVCICNVVTICGSTECCKINLMYFRKYLKQHIFNIITIRVRVCLESSNSNFNRKCAAVL